ncbi:hypothetical protein MIND_01399700 [Mycena indigotica]|uniref:Uncharacterized protein n=1 Tax=Mycena indigotica TaxID=2126181 RepID=A0A8H6RZ60_9AGAR|nr:uncharacterized protein MIND_01399700 [Mycena indigotica]KAF7289373.1 hypothetical protein MIND_01399700 [Mycena indigotica]
MPGLFGNMGNHGFKTHLLLLQGCTARRAIASREQQQRQSTVGNAAQSSKAEGFDRWVVGPARLRELGRQKVQLLLPAPQMHTRTGLKAFRDATTPRENESKICWDVMLRKFFAARGVNNAQGMHSHQHASSPDVCERESRLNTQDNAG